MADADATSPRLQCPEEPLAIIRTLQQAGFQAVLAGGCVRDMLLGRHPHDWDIATNARPGQVEALFPRTVAVGRQFGIVIVVSPTGTHYEVATFRGEADYSDGRHPDAIQFVEMEEDVKRRDFTVNALLFDPIASRVLDFVGGEADLRRGLLRAVGVPVQRFQEDRLRLLRAIRFAANLGFVLEESTWEAVKQCAPRLLPAVSQERIRDELEKMLLNGASRQAFHLLEKAGLLEIVLPEVARGRGIAQPPQFHPEGDVWQHQLKVLGFLDETMKRLAPPPNPDTETGEEEIPAALRFNDRGELNCATQEERRWLAWGTLLHDVGKPPTYQEAEDRIRFNGHDVEGELVAQMAMQRLRLDNTTVHHACYLVRRHMEAIHLLQAKLAKRRRALQEPLFPLLLEVVRLDTLASWGNLDAHRQLVQEWREETQRPHPPKPFINGRDLLQRGFHTGIALGNTLQACHDYELEHPFPTREEALAWLDQHIASPR